MGLMAPMGAHPDPHLAKAWWRIRHWLAVQWNAGIQLTAGTHGRATCSRRRPYRFRTWWPKWTRSCPCFWSTPRLGHKPRAPGACFSSTWRMCWVSKNLLDLFNLFGLNTCIDRNTSTPPPYVRCVITWMPQGCWRAECVRETCVIGERTDVKRDPESRNRVCWKSVTKWETSGTILVPV